MTVTVTVTVTAITPSVIITAPISLVITTIIVAVTLVFRFGLLGLGHLCVLGNNLLCLLCWDLKIPIETSDFLFGL